MSSHGNSQGSGAAKGLAIAGVCVGGYFLVREAARSERRKAQHLLDQLEEVDRAMTMGASPSKALGNVVLAQPRSQPKTRANAATSESPRLAPRTYDEVFAQHGQGIPVPYLRALALKESGMNPRSSSGPAWGLLQVVEVVRKDFNQRRHTTYVRNDLLDPAINVTIAASALATILHSYSKNHPHVANLQINWDNPRFVELVTFGWNAGWSERGGVGRVARYLEQRNIYDITIDSVHRAARAAGASEHLSNVAKVRWCKGVVAQYLRELASEPADLEMPAEYVGTARPIVVVASTDPPSVGPVRHPCELESASSGTGGVTATTATASAPAPSPSGAGLIDPYADLPAAVPAGAAGRPCGNGGPHA